MTNIQKIDRRTFLRLTSASTAGLILGVDATAKAYPLEKPASTTVFAPNVFIQIGTDNRITLWVHKAEMGQGVRTALPMLLADELEADWTRVDIQQAPFNEAYGYQGTGGSSSVRTAWLPLRQAGATAKAMLIAAGAQLWQVDPAECRAQKSSVSHPATGRMRTYGQLVMRAARLPVPPTVVLKANSDFTLIGKSLSSTDLPAICTGRAVYGLDIRLPGMRFAVIARSPTLAGKLLMYDPKLALDYPGVQAVVPVERGVAVIANSTWAAIQGREKLALQWDSGPHSQLTTSGIFDQFRRDAEGAGLVALERGDITRALAPPAKLIEATYQVAFVAHATMEPQNCTVQLAADHCRIWVPTQNPQLVHALAVAMTGLGPEAVEVNVTLLGGGFGRRLEIDYAREAIAIAQQVGGTIQLVWTRSDDFQQDYYRPGSLHHLQASLGDQQSITGWWHRVVAPSVIKQRWAELGTSHADWINQAGLDETVMLGASDISYAIEHIRVDYCMSNTPLPISWWRGTYDSLNAFANECFLDEIAWTMGLDPYQLRWQLLASYPRLRAVLELVAEKAHWNKPASRGLYRGLAFHVTYKVPVATVVEIAVPSPGIIQVVSVTSAVDCGLVVNPSRVRAQVEGAIWDGLTVGLKAKITVDDGKVQQHSFADYPLLRIKDSPQINVFMVASKEPPRGIGEPGVPPVAPALANAYFAATGHRIRQLPLLSTEK
ncbi:xanthine dehydrogenase family protein molybdopterin-binding subunit [Spirosoma gilvum]